MGSFPVPPGKKKPKNLFSFFFFCFFFLKPLSFFFLKTPVFSFIFLYRFLFPGRNIAKCPATPLVTIRAQPKNGLWVWGVRPQKKEMNNFLICDECRETAKKNNPLAVSLRPARPQSAFYEGNTGAEPKNLKPSNPRWGGTDVGPV